MQAGNAPVRRPASAPQAADNQWKAPPDEITHWDYAALYDFTAVTETSWRVISGVGSLLAGLGGAHSSGAVCSPLVGERFMRGRAVGSDAPIDPGHERAPQAPKAQPSSGLSRSTMRYPAAKALFPAT